MDGAVLPGAGRVWDRGGAEARVAAGRRAGGEAPLERRERLEPRNPLRVPIGFMSPY